MSPTCSAIPGFRTSGSKSARFRHTVRPPTSEDPVQADRADQRAAADYGIVLSRVETMMDDRHPGEARGSAGIHPRARRRRDDQSGNMALKIYLALVNAHLGDSYGFSKTRRSLRRVLRSANIASSGSTPHYRSCSYRPINGSR
jgi:hypothetical protein